MPHPQAKKSKCYACDHEGATATFIRAPDEWDRTYLCPKCDSEDVFPHWLVRCIKCNAVHPVTDVFGSEAELDLHPKVYIQHSETLREMPGCPSIVRPNHVWPDDGKCRNKLFLVHEY